jgi:hypothetical protein
MKEKMSVPPENLPICLREYTITFNSEQIRNVWNTITLYPTNKEFFRVWQMLYAGYISYFQKNQFILRITFTGTSPFIIDWETFPITGNITVGSKTYIVNSKQLSVVGQNYIPDKYLEIVCTFKENLCVPKEQVISINFLIYDNPGTNYKSFREQIV